MSKDINAIELSWDHKPIRKIEKERIINNAGRVEKLNYNGEWIGPYRIWIDEEGPGYGMTRTLGDVYSKKIGLISVPEIEHIKLKKTDQFIIQASDGLWEVMTSAEAVGFVLHNKEHWENENKVSQMLAKEARTRWEQLNNNEQINNRISDFPSAKEGVDDITVVILFLVFNNEKTDDNGITLRSKQEE